MFITYVIKNQSDKIYIGQTADLEKRLERHNNTLLNKKTSFTAKNKGPWKVIYFEQFNTRQEAIRRERALKSFQGREYIKKVTASIA